MNEVFLIGKIITCVNFGFMINSKHLSKVTFNLKTVDEQIIQICAYDKIADYVYSNLKQGDNVFIYGKLYRYMVNVVKIIILQQF